MSLPTNNKGKGKQTGKTPTGANPGGSKFISKPGKAAGTGGGGKKMIKTGGSRGS